MRRLLLAACLAGFVLMGTSACASAAGVFAHANVKITRLPVPLYTPVHAWDGDHGLIFHSGKRYKRVDLRTLRLTTIPVPKGCRLDALTAREKAAACAKTASGPVPGSGVLPDHFEVSPRSRERWTVLLVTPVNVSGEDELSISRFGTHWIELHTSTWRGTGTSYVSRDDGHQMVGVEGRTQADLNAEDLNRPHVAPPVCTEGPALGPHDRVIGRHRSWTFVRHATRGTTHDRLLLGRCGARRFITLCRGACMDSGAMTGELITWTAGSDGFAHNVRTGHTRRLHVPGRTVSPFVHGPHLLVDAEVPSNFDSDFGLVDLG